MLYALRGSLATVSNAEADDDRRVRLLFPDEDSPSTFNEQCEESRLIFDVERLFCPDDPAEYENDPVTASDDEVVVRPLEP